MRYISLKVLFITCVVGFGLVSCGSNSDDEDKSCADDSNFEKVDTLAKLKAIGDDADSMKKNYCLTKDIAISDAAGFPIGGHATDPVSFIGSFDGDNHKISGLTLDVAAQSYMGLFAKIAPTDEKEIKNLFLSGFSIIGKDHVGSLAGSVSGKATIKNVISSSASVTAAVADDANAFAGSLIGELTGNDSKVTDSTVKGGTITAGATGTNVGGLIGTVAAGADVDNSYSTAAVAGKTEIGGLVGLLKGSATADKVAKISNSYAIGVLTTPTTTSLKGGLVGAVEDCSATACIVKNSYFKAGTGILAISAQGTTNVENTEPVADATKIVEKDGKFYATEADSNSDDKDSKVIFKDWNKDSWKIEKAKWPTLKAEENAKK